jgi:hypothetical protein
MIRRIIIALAIATAGVAASLVDDAVECSAQVKQQTIPHCANLVAYLTHPNADAE